VQELAACHRDRDIDGYTKLLAPEFKFVFQPSDPSRPLEGFWTRDDDSTGTASLFQASEVIDIRIYLAHGPAEAPQDTGFAPDVVQILVNQAYLEVDEESGITWQVTDPQQFFFRPGVEENGEDTSLWYLLEWRDLPASSSPSARGATIRSVTWGSLKTRYIPVPPPPPVSYKPQTSPENVVHNLQVSYRQREILEYAKLLAQDFQFIFQTTDPSRPPEGFWARDEDSTGTDALFRAPDVIDIRIDLIHGLAEDPSEVGFDEGVKLIRINQTFLEVDEQIGITWQVTDLQDMFFRPGRAEKGEDASLWYLLEWRDLTRTSDHMSVATEATTWGRLKSKY
jgi:hypothetical protein